MSIEDMVSRLPLLGGFLGAQSDAEKNLLRKQEQMAREAAARRQQQVLEAPQMTATAQSLLAFNPMNQRMAATYGPEAAFTPQQFAQMVQNPNRFPGIDEWARGQGGGMPTGGSGKAPHVTEMIRNMRDGKAPQGTGMPGGVDTLVNYQGTDPRVQAQIEEYIRQKQQYEAAEARRRQMMEQGISQPGPGPAPLGPRPGPAPARRF